MSEKLQFGKRLASSDKKVRDKAVIALSQWLKVKSVDQAELLKLWKGLFYCFWMSDKPAVQSQLADILAGLALDLPDDAPIMYFSAFWTTMINSWNSIDRLRLDKFYLLLRRFHSKAFSYLASKEWDQELVEKYHEVLTNGPLHLTDRRIPDGLRYHTVQAYLEELANGAEEQSTTLNSKQFVHLLKPVYHVLKQGSDIWCDKAIEALDEFLTLLIDTPKDDVEKAEAMKRRGMDAKALIQRLEKLTQETDINAKSLKKIEKLVAKHGKSWESLPPPSPPKPLSITSPKKRKADGKIIDSKPESPKEDSSPKKKRKLVDTETPKIVKKLKNDMETPVGVSPATKNVSWSTENKIKTFKKHLPVASLTDPSESRPSTPPLKPALKRRSDQALLSKTSPVKIKSPNGVGKKKSRKSI